MEWYQILFLFVGSLILVMFTGLPIAFTFMLVSGTTMFLMFGVAGVRQLVLGVQSQLSNFTFTAIPFFVIMGEVFFQSGILTQTMDTLSKLVRKVPGRLSTITLMGGGIFSALSGSSLANEVMFGSLMMPEMKRRGYCMKLTTGTIMASGSLAMIIPPSNLAILMGGIAGISVGNILLGAIIPGFIMLTFFLIYVIGVCYLNPSLSPSSPEDDVHDGLSSSEKIKEFLRNIVPLLAVIIAVIGTIFLGIGTPTEAASIGAFSAYILAIAYGKFSLKLLFKTLINSLRSSVMLLIMIASSGGFAQVLSLTGTSRQAVLAVINTIDSPAMVLFVIFFAAFIIGLFVSESGVMMLILPLAMPLVRAYEINEVWFAVAFLLMTQTGQFTPPVGMALFAMKGVSPPDVSFTTILRGGIPFLIIIFIVILLVLAFPPLVLTIPGAW